MRLVGALITAVTLTVGLAAPAYAESFTDPVGDVAQIAPDNSTGWGKTGPDIARVKATLTPAWFTVMITLTGSASKGWDTASVMLDLDRNNVPDYSVELDAKNGALLDARLFRWLNGSYVGDVRAKASGKTLTIRVRADPWLKTKKPVNVAVAMGQTVKTKKLDSRIDDFPNRVRGEGSTIQGPIVWQVLTPTKQAVGTLKATTPKVKLVKDTVKKGTAAKLKISVKQKVSGTVLAFDGIGQYATALGSAKLVEGKTATLTLPKNLAAKYHAIRIRFMPDSLKHASSWSEFVTLIVKK